MEKYLWIIIVVLIVLKPARRHSSKGKIRMPRPLVRSMKNQKKSLTILHGRKKRNKKCHLKEEWMPN